MNYMLQSFFDHEEPGFSEVIYLTASKKTKEDENSDGLLMDRSVRQRVLMLNGGNAFEPVMLRALAVDQLGDQVVRDLLDNNVVDSALGRAIQRFLSDFDCHFPHDQFVTIPTRVIKRDLVMVTKYYPSRDDNRAYCRDSNLLRHVCGVMLHRLILPENMATRLNLSRNSVIPAKDKDILHIVLPKPRRQETAYLILGDISNFTGSLANAWIMLFCMVLELQRSGPWVKESNLYCMNGIFLGATWREILLLYLYLTVGYPAYVEELDLVECLPGGFLGVSANISTGLLFLAIVLQNLINLLQGTVRIIKAQAGGDDFAFGMVVSDDHGAEAIEIIREHFVKFVGPLKKFRIITLEPALEGVIPDAEFCKKEIQFQVEAVCLVVEGIENIPIHTALLPAGYLKRPTDALDAWFSYDRSLQIYERNNGMQTETDTLRELFVRIYPSVQPLRRRRVSLYCPHELEVTRAGKYLITNKALERVMRIPDVFLGSRSYITELTDKIRYALKTEQVTLRVIAVGRELTTDLILLRNEVRLLVRDETIVSVGTSFSAQHLSVLLDIINT